MESGFGLLSCRIFMPIGAWSWTAGLLRYCGYCSVKLDCCTFEGLCVFGRGFGLMSSLTAVTIGAWIWTAEVLMDYVYWSVDLDSWAT